MPNPEANMKTVPLKVLVPCVCRLLRLSVALILFAPAVTPAAEDGGATPKPAPQFNPVPWGTNADGKISGEFHDIDFDNVPLGDAVKHLQQLYRDQFDVLIPNAIPAAEQAPIDPNTGLPGSVEAIEANAIPIRLRLKNVTAPEIFRAMNMLFEMERTPARWDLIMFSSRPVAVLRPVESPKPAPPALPPPPPPAPGKTGYGEAPQSPPVQRVVLYIGGLTRDSDAGGMTLDSILKTLTATLEESFSPARSKVQCHAAAELLIVTGPPEELAFVTEVLDALKQKVGADRERKGRSPAAEPKTDRQRF